MPTITKKRALTEGGFGGSTPYGNKLSIPVSYETDATGKYVNSDAAAPTGNGDKVRLTVLPAGMRLQDALAIVSTAFAANTTAKIGFEYVDGVNDAAVPQKDDYFFAALATSAQGRTRATNNTVRPIVLPKDAYLILTRTGAADSAAGQLDLTIEGITS